MTPTLTENATGKACATYGRNKHILVGRPLGAGSPRSIKLILRKKMRFRGLYSSDGLL